MCWGYFCDLPDAVKLKLSSQAATKARRQLAFESQRIAFRELDDIQLAIGEDWEDACGNRQNVYVRIENLIVDYPDNAAATGTLQNQVCPICEKPKGMFHQPQQTFSLRTAEGSLAKWEAAEAAATSATDLQRRCRTLGLQSDGVAPLWRKPGGLDPHQGQAYARLHNDYKGTGQLVFEASLQLKYAQVGRGQWPGVERSLDKWVIEAARFTHFTSFSHGLSWFFYKKATNKQAAARTDRGTLTCTRRL